MEQNDFALLVEKSGLNLLTKYAPRFLVSLYMPTKWGTRITCDVLAYEPREFAALTPEMASQQIAACKARLERASKTKTGEIR